MSAKQKTRTVGVQAPDGWEVVRFGEIARCIGDRVDDPSKAGVERYVGLEHLDPESLKIRRWGKPTDVEAQKLRFQPGDIIFGKRRAYQRKLAVADFEGICSAHAMVLRANTERIEKDFLPFFMQSDVFFDRALSISVGSLSPTINWRTLAEQEFMLPSRKQQAKLVEMLLATETLLDSYIDVLEAARVTELAISEETLFGRRTGEKIKHTRYGHVPNSWDLSTIGEAGRVQLGRQRAPKYQTGRHTKPYLRVANVFDGYLDLTDVLKMDFDEHDFPVFKLSAGDILLNEGQSRELVGRCCIYRGEVEDCCFQNTLIRFSPSPKVISEFAFAYFRFLFHKGAFAQIASQTTSIAHLGADRFSELPMPIPPIAVQRRIVSHLEAFGSTIVRVRTALDNSRKLKAELLRKSTLNGNGSASHVQ